MMGMSGPTCALPGPPGRWRQCAGKGLRSLGASPSDVATSPLGSANALGARVGGPEQRRLTLVGGLTAG